MRLRQPHVVVVEVSEAVDLVASEPLLQFRSLLGTGTLASNDSETAVISRLSSLECLSLTLLSLPLRRA